MFVEYDERDGPFDAKDYDHPDGLQLHGGGYVMKFFLGSGREYFARWLARSTRYIPVFADVEAARAAAGRGLPGDDRERLLCARVFARQGSRPVAVHHTPARASAFASMPGSTSGVTGSKRRTLRRCIEGAARAIPPLVARLGGLQRRRWPRGQGHQPLRHARVLRHRVAARAAGRAARETKATVPKLIAAAIIAKSPRRLASPTSSGWRRSSSSRANRRRRRSARRIDGARHGSGDAARDEPGAQVRHRAARTRPRLACPRGARRS